jgi:hypothetical protein
MVKNRHQPKSFALEHDSLVNPTQNPEEPKVVSNQCNLWVPAFDRNEAVKGFANAKAGFVSAWIALYGSGGKTAESD